MPPSSELVPAKPLGLVSETPGQWNESQRARMEVLTWLEPDARTIELQVRGGLIEHYRDRGNVHFELFADQEATLEAVTVPPYFARSAEELLLPREVVEDD